MATKQRLSTLLLQETISTSKGKNSKKKKGRKKEKR
jgi:hypothetical protein